MDAGFLSRYPVQTVGGAVHKELWIPAEDLAELAISPAHEGTTGWFFKGTKRIDPPRSILDVDAQRALWTSTAEMVELEPGYF